MFVLRSTHAALKARYVQVLHQRDVARRDAAAHLGAAVVAAGATVPIDRTVRYSVRLERMVRATARLRAELAAANRRADAAQAAYDHAVGLDSPALDEGRHWQQRRSDKPRPKAVES